MGLDGFSGQSSQSPESQGTQYLQLKTPTTSHDNHMTTTYTQDTAHMYMYIATGCNVHDGQQSLDSETAHWQVMYIHVHNLVCTS